MVVDPKDVDAFLAYAAEENLEAVPVGDVTESTASDHNLERKDHRKPQPRVL